MKPVSIKLCSEAALLAALSLASGIALAQSPKLGGCGATIAHLDNPHYLIISDVILAAQIPPGWTLYEKKKNPFFLLRDGDQYATARTVIYINVQGLEVPFEDAVRKDEINFRKDNPEVRIVNEPQPEILEKGCAVKTQRFFYQKGKAPTVDRVTKIAVGKLLLNVVISSDSDAEIEPFKHDYEYLLKNLAVVGSP